MKRLTALLAVAMALVSACDRYVPLSEQGYIDFLYKYMPFPDSASYPLEYWQANVHKTLEVRDRMGWDVPEREFRHFVLPLRVNNETLDNFRTLYADTLCARVAGMTLEQAALEINHWCHEMATYQPSDARTSSPMATISRGLGRCGEESVLAVAALRAAGIPARQVYTPRWAHTDDNHAWVEVYVDGAWHFLGACEPEPRLDMAWFNAPVSRAMILHTKVFGDYHGDEDVITRTSAYTEINVIRGYVPARRSVVKVIGVLGEPIVGATVEFMIYNYGEFYPVARYFTDRHGEVALDMGCGDMIAWASKGNVFGMGLVDSERTYVIMDFNVGDEEILDFDIVPPVENPIPASASEEEVAANKLRFALEDSLRAARPKGNDAVISTFLGRHPDDNAQSLLASLSEKDLGDVTLDVLEDAYAHIDGVFVPERDCPRVEQEFLRPFFVEISSEAEVAGLSSAGLTKSDVAAWVDANISVDDSRNPQGLRMSPIAVWRSRKADSVSRDIFFVALCRAMGIEASLDAMTGSAQVEEAPKGTLTASYQGSDEPEYYHHFTLSRLVEKDGNFEPSLLTFDEDSDHNPWDKVFPVNLEEGCYMLTTGTRMADGSVLAHVEFRTVDAGKSIEIPLVMREAEGGLSVIGSMDADRFLPLTGRGYYLMVLLGGDDEPSVHCVRQMAACADALNEWGCKILVSGPVDELAGIDNLVSIDDADGSIFEMLCSGAKSVSSAKPLVALCDSFGHILYISQGYNTVLTNDLDKIVKTAK